MDQPQAPYEPLRIVVPMFMGWFLVYGNRLLDILGKSSRFPTVSAGGAKPAGRGSVRQERVGEGNGAGIGERGAHRVEQVDLGLDPTELRGLDQAVEKGGDLGAALGAGAVMILSSDDQAAQATLGGVVVERDPRILEEARQPRPESQHVADRLAEAAPGQRPLPMRPAADLRDDRPRLLGPQGRAQPQRLRAARLVRAAGQSGARPLHGVELPDEGEGLPARGQVVWLRLHELPADVRPAVRQG